MKHAFSQVISWIASLLAYVCCTFVKWRCRLGRSTLESPKTIVDSAKLSISLDHRSVIIQFKRKEAIHAKRNKERDK